MAKKKTIAQLKLELEEAERKEAEIAAIERQKQQEEDARQRMILAQEIAEKARIESMKPGKEGLDPAKRSLKWANIFHLWVRIKAKFLGHKTVVANFQLLNGDHDSAIVFLNSLGEFKYRNGIYLIDDTLRYWHKGMKKYCYDYHEGFTLPIKKEIPIKEIQASMDSLNIDNINYATNPSTLKTYINNNVIKQLVQSAALTDFFKQIRLLVILAAAGSIIHLALWAYKEGLFSGLM